MQSSPLQKLQALEQKITVQPFANLQIFQKQILTELKALRDTLLADSKTSSTAPTDEKKDKRITELETQNKRLQYRILHLTRNLRQALQRNTQ